MLGAQGREDFVYVSSLFIDVLLTRPQWWPDSKIMEDAGGVNTTLRGPPRGGINLMTRLDLSL